MAFASPATSSLPPLLLLLLLLLPLLAANNKPRRCRLCNRATRKRVRLPAALNEYGKRRRGNSAENSLGRWSFFWSSAWEKQTDSTLIFFVPPLPYIPCSAFDTLRLCDPPPLFFPQWRARVAGVQPKYRLPRSPLAAERCHSERQPIAFEAALTSAHLRVFYEWLRFIHASEALLKGPAPPFR